MRGPPCSINAGNAVWHRRSRCGMAAMPRFPTASLCTTHRQADPSRREKPEGTQGEAEFQLAAVVGDITAGDLLNPVQAVDDRVPVTVREIRRTTDGSGRRHPLVQGVEQ